MKEDQLAQIKRLRAYWLHNTSTAFMAAVSLDIPIQNICRYKRGLEKQGKLWNVKKDKCGVSGFKAWYLSCNPLYNKSNQLELFDESYG